MRLIVVLAVLTQSSFINAYRRPRSNPSAAFDPINPNYFGNTQYGGPVPQAPSFSQYDYTQQIPSSLIPQQALTRPNVHYLPPSQSQKDIKLPQDIDGYQLVHSGYPTAPESTQGQVNPQQNPQNIQGNGQYQIPLPNNYQVPTNYPAPNNYQVPTNYFQNKPLPISAPVTNLDQNQQQQLLPQNLIPQPNEYQIPSQNGIYQIPPFGYQNGFPQIPQQNTYPYSFNPQNVNQSPLPYLPQNIQQPFVQQQGVPEVQGVQQAPVIQGAAPVQGCQSDQGIPSAPQFPQYQPYTLSPISQDILPFLSQPNIPPNGQNSPNPYTQNPFLPNPYLPYPIAQNPNLAVQPSSPQQVDIIGNPIGIQGPGIQGPENIQNDPFLQLIKQQQSQFPQNGQGYEVIKEYRREFQYPPISKPQPEQQQNPQVNDEGYQVVNEGPVTHYVTMGEPNTKIVSLERPENGQTVQRYQYMKSYRSNSDPINTPTQPKQPQVLHTNVTHQTQGQQSAEDCEPGSQTGDSQKQPSAVAID